MSARIERGERIVIKPGLYYAYDGRLDRSGSALISVPFESRSVVFDVIEDSKVYPGRHLIVPLPSGTIDIWTSQDQFCYRRA